MWSETISVTMIQNMASNGCGCSLSKMIDFFIPENQKVVSRSVIFATCSKKVDTYGIHLYPHFNNNNV